MIKDANPVYGKYSVLIVDDHRTMLEIVHSLLIQIGFNDVDMAQDGISALQKITNKKFDLIISDWNMPNMDGLELLKKVRSNPNSQIKSVTFVLVTGEAKPENILAAKQAGVNNYIVKPLSLVTLKQKLDKTLGIA
jgi:two-component system, chemotaxis family, chemotaxis protein CheY